RAKRCRRNAQGARLEGTGQRMQRRAAEGKKGLPLRIIVPARKIGVSNGTQVRGQGHGTARTNQSSASVATSFQFGSFERVSRANVQTALTSATASGSP